MPFDVQISKGSLVEDGRHTGTLVRFEEREGISKTGQTFEYIDCIVKLLEGGKDIELKTGAPKKLGETTKLGKLLIGLGVDVKPLISTGKEVNLEKVFDKLKGKRVTFMTLQEQTARGNFARIVEGSLKLA